MYARRMCSIWWCCGEWEVSVFFFFFYITYTHIHIGKWDVSVYYTHIFVREQIRILTPVAVQCIDSLQQHWEKAYTPSTSRRRRFNLNFIFFLLYIGLNLFNFTKRSGGVVGSALPGYLHMNIYFSVYICACSFMCTFYLVKRTAYCI